MFDCDFRYLPGFFATFLFCCYISIMLAAHEMTSSLSPICADNSRPPVPYYPNAINSYYSEQAYK